MQENLEELRTFLEAHKRDGHDMLEAKIQASANDLQEKLNLKQGTIGRIAQEVYSFQINKLEAPVFYGLMGEVIRKLLPLTEASPVSLALSFLAAFGSIVGRSSYFVVGGSRHFPNLFCIIIGNTSKARKGTSWDLIKRLFNQSNPEFVQDCIKSGLSSGEGIIYHLRDPQYELRTRKGVTEKVMVDEGVTDKRILAIESEFASLLKIMRREGNTVSPVIRDAWDGSDLTTLTKNNPVKATAPHFGLLGHCTETELKKYLSETEMANGFANRFLIAIVGRSKLLPNGADIEDSDLMILSEKLRKAIKFSQTNQQLKRNKEAQEKWIEIYPALSSEREGLIGSVIARAEAHVLRLSMIYALLDSSNLITIQHLDAALALWSYVENSCEQLFGEASGNSKADKAYKKLIDLGGRLTRSEINNEVFQRNSRKSVIDAIKDQMIHENRIQVTYENHIEYWQAK